MRLPRLLAPVLFLAFGCHAPTASVVELVESTPSETAIATPGVPEAADVWLAMIRGAKQSIDVAEFYVSDQDGSRFHQVVAAIEEAAGRGVHVRLLVDDVFYEKYPTLPDAWKKKANMEVKRLDLKPGVLHAKYFVVDGRDAYVGSQNFDYRSLEHIFEIGVHTDLGPIARGLEQVFTSDWDHTPLHLDAAASEGVTMKVSPEKLAGRDASWDLPLLLAKIGAAKREIDVEVLTYKKKNRDGSSFTELDDALRAAAARGVKVKLLISTWGEKDEAVKALATTPNVEVAVIAVGKHSSGEIPFARVAHAKYALFDGAEAWVGTGNWEGDYFYQSRNVSLFATGGPIVRDLARVFAHVHALARPPEP